MIAVETTAAKRAMPLQRLLAHGLDWADATALHASEEPWHETARRLGDANRARAEAASNALTARSFFLRASACYRFGQIPLTDDDPLKREMYVDLIDCFARGGPFEHVQVPWRGSALACWLLLPASGEPPPVVIQFGGFDGWREEYYDNARYLLERGVGCLLADGPGQGETRLFNGVYLDADVADAFSALVDFLAPYPSVGIWGNSMGGFLAAYAASRDERIAACCVNGGTVRPTEILDRFPRFVPKIEAMCGSMDVLDALRIDLPSLRCPLHVVHGAPDQVFLIENARALYDGAASADKTFSEFPDGDHCIYNHAHERNCLIADWFRRVL